jgi:hypothetical protein
MTDHPAPTDEDLSLALDGAADDDLLARIEADPAARARLDRMRRAAALVAAPVAPLDDEVVDGLISTAVDAPVAPPRPARRPSGAAPWLVAAAVILLMAVGLSLVWAGRGADDDQASATFQDKTAETAGASSDGEPDSSFGSQEGTGAGMAAGGHGAPTTTASPTASTAADLPILYLGSYASGDALREATATSFADAWKASGSPLSYDTGAPRSDEASSARAVPRAPTDAAIDRCAQQLQVTLSTEAPPIQTGYARVDGKDVLAYEFATPSARTGKETTLVAAVGVDACDAVVIFER